MILEFPVIFLWGTPRWKYSADAAPFAFRKSCVGNVGIPFGQMTSIRLWRGPPRASPEIPEAFQISGAPENRGIAGISGMRIGHDQDAWLGKDVEAT